MNHELSKLSRGENMRHPRRSGMNHFIAINFTFLFVLFFVLILWSCLHKVPDGLPFWVVAFALQIVWLPFGLIFLRFVHDPGALLLVTMVQCYFWSVVIHFGAPYIKNRKQSLIGAIKTLRLFALLLILAGCAFFALAFFTAPRIYDNGYYDLSARLLNVSLFPLKTVCRWFDYYPADTVAGLKNICVLQAFFWSLVAWPVVYYAKKWFKK